MATKSRSNRWKRRREPTPCCQRFRDYTCPHGGAAPLARGSARLRMLLAVKPVGASRWNRALAPQRDQHRARSGPPIRFRYAVLSRQGLVCSARVGPAPTRRAVRAATSRWVLRWFIAPPSVAGLHPTYPPRRHPTANKIRPARKLRMIALYRGAARGLLVRLGAVPVHLL